ncbi:MAG: DegT/DnrJ/EryC1/StrS family aminotransferase [Spirochaetaceae bacterium]|nr:MAG: DegT/DnrJ/EryC1/StrS family aminotransferase [Spirochaetaceae bacterium]
MKKQEELGTRAHHLIDTKFGARELRKLGELELKYLAEVMQGDTLSNYISEQSMTRRFEEAFAKKVGAKKAMAKNSAMAGLVEAVSVSGAGPGYEVVCDPIVHFGGLAAIYFNAVPRFADVRRDTYNMDPDSLLANITPLTKAVILTHMWGQSAEIDTIADICRDKGIFLIEDCAHAINSTWNGRHVGTFGDLGVFSFQEFKHLSTGDGGMTITNNAELFDQMRGAWWFSGESPKFMYVNYRMNEVTAAVGLAQLEKVDGIIETYNKTLAILNDAIAGCEWLKARHVPKQAHMSGYWWSCAWEGDKHGLSYEKFKRIELEMGVGLRFGFNVFPAYEFPFFRESTAYRTHPDCPVRCPFYTAKSNYRYTWGLTPVLEDLMQRLITVNLIFLSIPAAEEMAGMIRKLIKKMEE